MFDYHSLKNCFHNCGCNHSDLIGIKRFLNANYQVKSSNIPLDSRFCKKTQSALAEFQQAKGLKPTGGLDIKTWQAIGDEISVSQFESAFGNSPNIGVLRNVVFGNRLRRMFPTATHTALIIYAFQDGSGDGGLSAKEVSDIDYGSKLTDTYFGTGGMIDIPITLIASEAPKHAMTPEGMTVETAMKEAYKWIDKNAAQAREDQRKIDIIRAESDAKRKQTPELGYLERVPVLMSSTALTAFGKACHTYMDSVSPAHHGWQQYSVPKMTVKMTDPETGMVIGEVEKTDIIKFALEGWAHKNAESAPPTQEQRDECALYMRGAFLTTFGNRWFRRAVKSDGEREKVYSFIKSKGLFWEEDLAPSNFKDIKDSPLHIKPRDKNFQEPGVGVVHYT